MRLVWAQRLHLNKISFKKTKTQNSWSSNPTLFANSGGYFSPPKKGGGKKHEILKLFWLFKTQIFLWEVLTCLLRDNRKSLKKQNYLKSDIKLSFLFSPSPPIKLSCYVCFISITPSLFSHSQHPFPPPQLLGFPVRQNTHYSASLRERIPPKSLLFHWIFFNQLYF